MRVLLICPLWMDIYKDIVEALLIKGYDVDYISEISDKHDPKNVRGYNYINSIKYENKLKNYWSSILQNQQYNKNYDILFVIDGQGVHPIVFDILLKRNPQILKVNYLFDTISGVYHFEKNFPFFDRVYTFDLKESKIHDICFLPIYWKEEAYSDIIYKFFGFGSYIKQRFELFAMIQNFANSYNLNSFIKIFAKNRFPLWIYDVRRLIRKFCGLNDDHPRKLYESPLAYDRIMSPSEFRTLIYKSEIIIDTAPVHQDGLTARFMWALGAGKKIITTNINANRYPFYNKKYIYIIDDISNFEYDSNFEEFVFSKYIEDNLTRNIINEYRIDNWLNKILLG